MRPPLSTTMVLLLTLQLVEGQYRTWRKVGIGAEAEIRQLAAHPTSQSSMMMIDDKGGIYRTDDGGNSWFPRWHRLPARLDLQGIAFVNSMPTTVLLTTTTGFYRSTDSGENWVKLEPYVNHYNVGIGENAGQTALMLIASSQAGQNSTVYIGTGHTYNTKDRTNPCVYNAKPAIYSSADQGATWVKSTNIHASAGFKCTSIEHLVMDPLDPGAIYVATSRAGGSAQFNPVFTYSSDYSVTFDTTYIADFLVSAQRVSAMSFTSSGLVLCVAYDNGQVMLGARAEFGGTWHVRTELASSANSYIQSLALSCLGFACSIYAGTEQTTGVEDSGLQLGSVDVPFVSNSSFEGFIGGGAASWTALANAWDAKSSGWDASPWNISAILSWNIADSTLVYIVDTHRVYSSSPPYTSWSSKYSSRPQGRKGWTSHGSDTHEFTYVLPLGDDPSTLLFGSATDVLFYSMNGGGTLLPAKDLIEQASQAANGPTSFALSNKAFVIDTTPNMFLIHCSSNMTSPDEDKSRLILKRRDGFATLSNVSNFLRGNVSMTSAAPGQMTLASGGKVYELSGFQSIADGLTLSLSSHTLIGHADTLPNIEAQEWNSTLNTTQWQNYSMAVSNPDYFGGECSSVIDILHCAHCNNGSGTNYILLCAESVYQYSSVLSYSTNFLGYTREMHWTTPEHCNYWVNGIDSGVTCAPLKAARDDWRASSFFGWMNGGELFVAYSQFLKIFEVPSTMILLTNRSIHAQYNGSMWIKICEVVEVMDLIGWGGGDVDFTTATYLSDSTTGYKLLVSTRHHDLAVDAPYSQATRVILITPTLSLNPQYNSPGYTVVAVDSSEDLGPVAFNFLSAPTMTTSGYEHLYAASSDGAWTWHKTSLVSSGVDWKTTWPDAALGQIGAFGNVSMRAPVMASGISSSHLIMYRINAWVNGECQVRIIPESPLIADHLISTLPTVATGSWFPTRLEIALPATSSSFDISFENVGSGCYVDRPWLGSVSNDLGLDDSFDAIHRLSQSEVLSAPAQPVLVSTTSTAIRFTWSAPLLSSKHEAISAYLIEYRLLTVADLLQSSPAAPPPPPATYTAISLGSTTTSHTIAGLTNGASYQIRVTYLNVVGYSEPSDPLLATCHAVVPDAPVAPSLLNTARSREIMLTWSAPSYDGTSDIIGYKINVQGPSPIPFFTSNTTEVIITNLTPDNPYSFTVNALNAVGESAASSPSDEIQTIGVADGLCNVTMKLQRSTTILENYPYGTPLYASASAESWRTLFRLDLAHTMGINETRISDMVVESLEEVLIGGSGLRQDIMNVYVTFWLKTGYLVDELPLPEAKNSLLLALVDPASLLYQGIVSRAVDDRYLRYDGLDPGVAVARQALGGHNSRLDEKIMQLIGLSLFIGLPLLYGLTSRIQEWLDNREQKNAYRDKYNQ